MKKYAIITSIALSLGQLSASTYVSGTGTSVDPILLDVGVNLTANVVLGNGATLITPGGGGIFSDLDPGGYILINPGQTVEITFNSAVNPAFTGEVTLFDVDSNDLNGTNQDQIQLITIQASQMMLKLHQLAPKASSHLNTQGTLAPQLSHLKVFHKFQSLHLHF